MWQGVILSIAWRRDERPSSAGLRAKPHAFRVRGRWPGSSLIPVPRLEFEATIEQHFEIIDKREAFGRELALVMKAKP